MEKRYISESRYKKGTVRKRRSIDTVRSNLTVNKQAQVKPKTKIKIQKKVKKKTIKSSKQTKTANIIICVILLVLIAVISRAILKDENEPFIPLPFMVPENEEIIRIGVITQSNLLDYDTNNVVINELNKYSKDMLLEINEDYSITYKCISGVTKVSNKEYIVLRNEESDVNINSIKSAIDGYRKDKNSVYYTKLSNISSTSIVDENSLNVKLKNNDPYFIYNLDICLESASDNTNYVQDSVSTSNKLVFNRNKNTNKELPKQVIVTKYKDMYAAVEAYKESKINMFITNTENVENILGKYDYNIKAYRNGKSVFLLSNPKSELYQKEEVRQAIAYSIDRDGIIKNVLKSKGDKIDLPYIYDSIKYKYDVYAAENLLLTNKYAKSNKVYSKTENGVKTTLQLDLIVNKSDSIKVSIANRIKNNLNAIGIKINIEKLTSSDIKTRVKNGDYDLLLASVNLNNSPDISFIYSNLYLAQDMKKSISNVNNSSVQELNTNIINLQNVLSQNIAAIGIYCDVSYLIYSKDIIGIENISYMNLFKDILN